MRKFIEYLCGEACAGRAPGTPGGREARRLVIEALRQVGLEPQEQAVPGCQGANVLARVPGEVDRWVLVGAHYDHLGRIGRAVYPGADDNAAAVAILVEVARSLAAAPPKGRGVLVAAFDAEEPPHFLSPAMGSEHYARNPAVPLERTDLMICMDLVGHAVGPEMAAAEVRATVFALGAERSVGTAAQVDRLARAVPGVVVRRADAEIVPPLSDYEPFWRRGVPFLFLTNGRWRHYHKPTDTPDRLDYAKIAATAQWLELFLRVTCARPETSIRALPESADDASTLRSIAAVAGALAEAFEAAGTAVRAAEALQAECDSDGRLAGDRDRVRALVTALEEALA